MTSSSFVRVVSGQFVGDKIFDEQFICLSITHDIQYHKAGIPTGTGASTGEKCLDTTNFDIYTFSTTWGSPSALSTEDKTVFRTSGVDTSGNSGTYTADNYVREYTGTSIQVSVPSASWRGWLEDKLDFIAYTGTQWKSVGVLTNKYKFAYRLGFGQSQTKSIYESSGISTIEVPPKNGYIVSIVVSSNSPRTAGTFTAKPVLNGSPIVDTSLNTILDGSNVSKNTSNIAPGNPAFFFSALTGELGIQGVSDGSWLTSSGIEDIIVDLYVVFEG